MDIVNKFWDAVHRIPKFITEPEFRPDGRANSLRRVANHPLMFFDKPHQDNRYLGAACISSRLKSVFL